MLVDIALTRCTNGSFDLTKAELDADLLPNEVLVQLVATGMCHTDLSVRDGYLPFGLPGVLGHEGSGVVSSVGQNVKKVQPGDHVVLTYPYCGVCENCQRGKPTYCPKTQEWIFSGTGKRSEPYLAVDGNTVNSAFMGQSSFCSHVVSTEDAVIPVRKDVPLELLGPLGCGFQTGAGAVLRSLQIPSGSSLAIYGTGSVGLAAVMASHLSGVGKIIAVDVVQSRLNLALELGATHTVNASQGDSAAQIKEITGGVGAQFSLWATGVQQALTEAFECLSQTGTCGVLGVAPPGSILELSIYELFKGKSVRGILAGDSIPDLLIPQLVDFYVQGRFPMDRMVKYYDFTEINQAAEDLERGVTIKPILRFDH